MRFLGSQRGQATIDYVALIAILALLLGAAAAGASGAAAGMTNAVLGQLRHALCIVTGGSCPGRRPLPCVVASDRDGVHIAMKIAFFRVDRDRVVLRERMSDGTVRLTLIRRSGVGFEVGVGGRAQLRLKGRTIGSQHEAHGGVEGVAGFSEVFVARDAREADEVLHALNRPRLPLVGGPRPRELFVEGGVRGLGRLGIGAAAASAALDSIAEGVVGARRDQRSGDVTISLSVGGSGWALLSALMAAPSGSLDRTVGLELTFDRHRRPTSLSLTASGTLGAGPMPTAGFGGPQATGAGAGYRGNTSGRRWELEARVDLRDPDVAAAWAAFRHDPTNPAAIRALGAQLRSEAYVDTRGYALRSDFDGAAGELALGPKLGGELDRTRDRARLLWAATRPPGGLWEQRVDCAAAV
jgi:hypothetical protein